MLDINVRCVRTVIYVRLNPDISVLVYRRQYASPINRCAATRRTDRAGWHRAGAPIGAERVKSTYPRSQEPRLRGRDGTAKACRICAGRNRRRDATG